MPRDDSGQALRTLPHPSVLLESLSKGRLEVSQVELRAREGNQSGHSNQAWRTRRHSPCRRYLRNCQSPPQRLPQRRNIPSLDRHIPATSCRRAAHGRARTRVDLRFTQRWSPQGRLPQFPRQGSVAGRSSSMVRPRSASRLHRLRHEPRRRFLHRPCHRRGGRRRRLRRRVHADAHAGGSRPRLRAGTPIRRPRIRRRGCWNTWCDPGAAEDAAWSARCATLAAEAGAGEERGVRSRRSRQRGAGAHPRPLHERLQLCVGQGVYGSVCGAARETQIQFYGRHWILSE